MITINGKELAESSTFPGGELHIKLPNIDDHSIVIISTIRNSDDLVRLLLVKNAVDYAHGGKSAQLVCTYLPYARQDRICNPGEAFSLEVIASIIRTMKFKYIWFFDVHSEAYKYLDWGCDISHIELSYVVPNWKTCIPGIINKILVAPDAGASSKVELLANKLGCKFIGGEKRRSTDGIKVTIDDHDGKHIQGREVLIVDDICDGGGTFVALSEELMKFCPSSIQLYVTHGIFSKGFDVLKNAYISHVYTTDSYCALESTEYLTVFNVSGRSQK